MTAALHRAGPEDMERLLPMVAAYHAVEGIETGEAHRRAALGPILEGSPHGAVYLIGPRDEPSGYIVLSFGWSVEFGGLDAFVDEFWIAEGARGRGLGSGVLSALIGSLEAAGLRALHLEVARDNARAAALYARLGFEARDGYRVMSRTARR